MAVHRVDRAVARAPNTARTRDTPRTDTRRDAGIGPVVTLIRSLLMLALAAIAILGLLPAVVAAQAAATF
jgi:hypothetical protein